MAKQPPLKTLTNFFSTARYFAAAGGFTKSGARWRRNKKEKKEEIELNYDECDFPLPYSEKRCIEGWFDFNDSTVTPILPGKLQSMYGNGSGGENAYILVYRQKKMCQELA